ncbi:MAG: choice-of-anchor I family protein [Flavobacteriales bacterium]|nr:choice-of-anchor I family protein [Flavobacteriales bacterium]
MLWMLLAITLMATATLASAQISISHLSTHATGSYNTSSAEIVAFDPSSDRIFFVNALLNQVVALNASNPASLTPAFTIDMATYGAVANSLCVVPGGIAVAAEASPKTDPGKVVFFDAAGTFLSQVTVGAQPDHVTASPDGLKVLAANEGEPNDDYSVDPEGSISIIDISGGLASLTNANVTSIGFTAYTPAMLPGVRIFGPGATVAQDMEPEYIAVSDDSQKAFVACQENNAVVRIDLATNTIEHITSLGMKDHSLPGNGLDASDSPAGINIQNWPVKGLYMPDAIDAFTIGGQTYVAYANEGDAREWGTFVEPRRIGNAAYVLDPTVFPDAATLKLNANLGRLNATIYSGDTDDDTDFDEIHVFGSRSFTIRDANGVIVWDSGDQLEQITAAAYPTNFNSTNSANSSFDNRSDDKGPEPEAITVANVFGSTYAFIGLERIGGIVVFDVSVPSAPVFIQYLNNRDFNGDAAAGTALDLGPEDIKFVSAADSPDGQPFLIVGNEVSGTVSLFRINPPPTPEDIAVWTYEPLQGTATAPTPNTGTGSSAVVGSMTGATTATGSTTGCAQVSGTTAWAIGTATPGTNESSGVEFRTSTVGYENITFSYDHRLSNSATRTARIQYTLDGSAWNNLTLDGTNYDNGACTNRGGLDNGRIDASDPAGTNVSDSWGRRTIDFSAIAGADDNPDFGVRVLAAHYSSTGEFRQANNVSSIATAGTWRFDNVTFQGIELPVVAVIDEPVPTSLTGFSTPEGSPSAEQTFTISASDLTADLVITAPAGFELREQGIGSYGSSLNLTGPALSATIEVRLDGITAGIYSGNVTLASTGAISRTVSVDGETEAPPVPGVLAVWTYEPLQGAAATPTPNIGSGMSAVIGSMSGATTAAGSTTGCAQATGTTAWQIGSAAPGTTSESSGVEFRTSTVGHENIVFSYDHRHSNSSTRTARIQYTLDGTNWINLTLDGTNYENSACANRGGLDDGRIDASDPIGTNVSDSWGRRVIDFSGITGANNNPDFGIRILASHYSTTGEFRQANNVTSIATGGTWRFDNVSFTADVIVPPTTFTLQILHASDFEGAVPATEDAPRFAAIVDSLEHTYLNSVTLSSGDNFLPGPFMSAGEDPSLVAPLKTAYENYYGGPFANNDLRAGIGRVDITIMNLIGIQAAALGNHEFDLGTSELRNIIAGQSSGTNIRWFGAQFPYLSSNLDFSADANLSNLFTNTREEYTFFQSNPAMGAPAIAATKKLAPSTIITVNGEKLGIVGATTQILASISSPGATTIIGPDADDMLALAGILQPVIDSLRIVEAIDKIIVLSHLQQLTLEKALAPLLNGVDVIIAGGSHTLMADATDRMRTGDVPAETYPYLTTGLDGKPVAIVNTTSEYRYVGRLVVEFDENGEIIPASIDPAISGAYPADSLGVVEVWGDYADAFTPGSRGQEVANLSGAIEAVIIAKDGNLFGKTDVFLEGRRNFVRTEETNLGNVSADANKWMARRYDPSVTISIKNGGGIRSAIGYVNAVGGNVNLEPPQANPLAGKQQGDISQLDIENSLRFNNLLSALTLTAADLRTILEHGVAASGPGQTQGRFPQVSGVRFSYDETLTAGARILNAVVTDSAGVTVDTLVMNGAVHGDPGRTFRVVTLNFLANGGDGYPFNTLGTARADLNTLPDAGPGVAAFAIPGSEQDAFAEFMKSFHDAGPYALAETPASLDERIQEVNDRTDCILPPLFYADSDGDGFGDPNDFTTNCPGSAPSGYVSDATDDCPTLFGKVGDSCDAGPGFVLGQIDGTCTCVGLTCTTDLDFVYQADGVDNLNWELRQQGTNILVQNGGGLLVGNGTDGTCLPDGCFYLVVADGGGDGIMGGGYLLRINSSARLIDNLSDVFGQGGFTSGATSAILGNEGFCLPVGTDRLISTSCDKMDWRSTSCGSEYVVANANGAVSVEFGGPNAATSGYQMWWYAPNGGYSFKRFQSHNTSNGLPASATRAAHFRINGWTGNQLQEGQFCNVKVRGRVNGVYSNWGPACRFMLNSAAAQCPRTKLMDLPGNQYLSCGQSRAIGNNVYVHARPAKRQNANCAWVNANRYQFRFRIPSENVTIVKNSAVGQYFVNTNGLVCGKTYEVDVRASFDNGANWCHSSDPYGDVCTLTTVCSSGMAEEGGSAAANEARVAMYPNPNIGDQLLVRLSQVEEGVGSINVDIYDSFGKRVAQRTIGVQDGYVSTAIALNGELANGMYLVSFTAGSAIHTERLMIQR